MANYDGLNPALAKAIQSLIAASGGRVQLVSGYRSVERQAQLFAAAVKKYGSEKAARRYVAPPGKSNHNHGNAVDLGGDLAWVAANAARFGLVQPMSWEKWHFELAGARNAKQGHTTAPGEGDVAATTNPIDDLEHDRLGDPQVQMANLLAIFASPADTATASYQ